MQDQIITFQQLAELHESYTLCGLGESRNAKFIESIISAKMMPRGGGISWLEQIIKAGKPAVSVARVAELTELASKSRRKDTTEILMSFADRLRRGGDLTDRQRALLETLKKQVEENLPDIELTDRQRSLLSTLARMKNYNSRYWSSRPAISSRIDRIFSRLSDEVAISQDDYDYVTKNFKGVVTAFFDGSKKHPAGSLRWLYDGTPLTVMGEVFLTPEGTEGVLVNVLHPKQGIIPMKISSLYIRAPKLCK
jgi:hypothetical protein